MTFSAGGYVHATAIVIDGRGVLIRGRSRAGKSTLAEVLIAAARGTGSTAMLVGDDRVRLAATSGAITISPHPAIAGRIERRGAGIFTVEYESAAILALVIDLVDDEVHRETPISLEEILPGIALPHMAMDRNQARNAPLPLVLAALAK